MAESDLSSTSSPVRKKKGFWKDDGNLRSAIREFMETLGRPDEMPTAGELRQAGRIALCQAIMRTGGFKAVAERLGYSLPIAKTKRPNGYWQDFESFKRELLAFISKWGEVGKMPTITLLRKHKAYTLITAIGYFGGPAAVAERLGLWRDERRSTHGQRHASFWNVEENFIRELHALAAKQGEPGRMPPMAAIRKHRGGMKNAVIKRGGPYAVAVKYGLEYRRKPNDYWDDIHNIVRELRPLMDDMGIHGRCPTITEIERAGRPDLASGIIRFPGRIAAVAAQMGLPCPRQRSRRGQRAESPADAQPQAETAAEGGKKTRKRLDPKRREGYLKVYENFERELRGLMAAACDEVRLPPVSLLKALGEARLERAFGYFGGRKAVAARMGLEVSQEVQEAKPQRRPSGYWRQFESIDQEVRALMSALGIDGMPTRQQMIDLGPSSLYSAILKFGGRKAVAARMGIPELTWQACAAAGHRRAGKGFEYSEELRAFAAASGHPDQMPTDRELRAAGMQWLIQAIRTHGGFRRVARRLGLQWRNVQHQTVDPLKDYETVKAHLTAYLAGCQDGSRMPTSAELIRAGLSSLDRAIFKYHGGLIEVGRRMGLQYQHLLHPAYYYDHPDNVRQEARLLMLQNGLERLPTPAEAEQSGFLHLALALQRFDLNCSQPQEQARPARRKPYGYYRDITNIEGDLREYMTEHGLVGVLPRLGDLRAAGLTGLAEAIRRIGESNIAARLGLRVVEKGRRRSRPHRLAPEVIR